MNNHNEIVDERDRNYIEHLLVELYNDFNNNVNMNIIKFNTLLSNMVSAIPPIYLSTKR